ncbi:MAG: molybdopterin molybdotransferase MoeA [Acidobacteriota bacterium]|nr:molybdopterin molybdotransferase MoeA [Acidobacteriota bacterium]
MTGTVDFDQALETVLQHASALAGTSTETLPLLHCRERVLATSIRADRDQPPFDRATRDGFAVRASDEAGALHLIGSVRAGEQWQGPTLTSGQAIEIMTGAPMPPGSDAVLMVEHAEQQADTIRPIDGRKLHPRENVVPRGSEARACQSLLTPGTLLEAAEIALASSCGYSSLTVFRKPKVAIIATGDELVELDTAPELHQIRNSNSYSLAALAASAGAEPIRLGIAADQRASLLVKIAAARTSNLLLLSGGVSMGKYDLVEEVLLSLGAEFFFTGIRMQPGKPLVFGRLPATERFPALYFFGLPGNPISTQVTFHCFAAPLLRALAGSPARSPRFAQATLSEAVEGKPGIMRVLPAHLTSSRSLPQVRLVPWHGSGDLAANARANCYAVLPPGKSHFAPGEVITILLR